ncbi:MAG TPA: serine protease [Kofleriaceae bacterium]|nr:serine protease [Kofleriaceae bacterium]
MRRQMRPIALARVFVSGLLIGCGGGPSAGPPDPPGPGDPPDPVCGPAPAARSLRAQCGATLDFTPINAYAGDFPHVQDREDAVVLISGDCTGTLIDAAAGPVVLTAGHCVTAVGDEVLLAFNDEADPDGDPLVTNGSVIERAATPDYALIAPDQLPVVTPSPLTRTPSAALAIIQHPRGGPKVIATGAYLAACNGIVSYTDLDTLVGSSGAGVLTTSGGVLGVHTDGSCTAAGGLNYGWSSEAIVAASAYLAPGDLGDL